MTEARCVVVRTGAWKTLVNNECYLIALPTWHDTCQNAFDLACDETLRLLKNVHKVTRIQIDVHNTATLLQPWWLAPLFDKIELNSMGRETTRRTIAQWLSLAQHTAKCRNPALIPHGVDMIRGPNKVVFSHVMMDFVAVLDLIADFVRCNASTRTLSVRTNKCIEGRIIMLGTIDKLKDALLHNNTLERIKLSSQARLTNVEHARLQALHRIAPLIFRQALDASHTSLLQVTLKCTDAKTLNLTRDCLRNPPRLTRAGTTFRKRK